MIKNIYIENFKFHKKLNVLMNNNLAIYGENGSGKSSIYFALYYTFYKKLIDNEFQLTRNFKNRELSEEETVINIELENKDLITFDKDGVYSAIDLNADTIHFANHDILDELIKTKDFFKFIEIKFKDYFSKLNNLVNNYTFDKISATNYKEINVQRIDFDQQLKEYLENILKEANSIIEKGFDENFKLSLDFHSSLIRVDDNYEFDYPKIYLKIDELDDLKYNFNEAKLKLMSVSIFFALIDDHYVEESDIKLLVLDDFLTSLDMSNRAFIIKYILDNFKKFQKIILTHNLQFFNLFEYSLKNMDLLEEWDFQNIYTRLRGNETEAKLYSKPIIDLEELEKKAKNIQEYSDFKTIGNEIRKEFERLIHEMEKYRQLGIVEKINTIIGNIIHDKPIYYDQNELLIQVNSQEKIEDVKRLIREKEYYPQYLKEVLKSLIFFRKISLHPASHYDIESDIYHKEYLQIIKLLKELSDYVDQVKKLNPQGGGY